MFLEQHFSVMTFLEQQLSLSIGLIYKNVIYRISGLIGEIFPSFCHVTI
jgi:hypothetical protein